MYFPRFAVCGLALATMLAGCSGSGGGNSGAGNFSDAKWAVLLQPGTLPAPIVQLGMNFTQNGDTISSDGKNSTLSVTNCDLNVPTIGSVGTVKDGAFNLVFSFGSESITLVGTIAAGGQSVSGTFTSSGGACLNGESGTFEANFVSPATGAYAGTLTNEAVTGAPATTMVAMLSEDANFNESATITVQGNNCFSSLATPADSLGVSIGGFTIFNATDGTNTVSFIGMVNSDASQISGGWAVLAGCTGQSGIFQLRSSILAAKASAMGSAMRDQPSAMNSQFVERMRAILAARRPEAQPRE
jgi:hypothetical protein